MEVTSSLLPFNSPVISFTLLFGAIYLIGYALIFRRWGGLNRYDASSCFISLFHGSPAVIMSILALIESTQNKKTNNLLSLLFQVAEENRASQDLVLEFSIGYFIIDLLHYIIFIPKDVLFIAHHCATLYVLVSCRYVVHHGGASILGLLVLAEVTSPCQNTWSLARFRKVDLPEAARYYEFLSPYFFTFYSVVRGVLGPLYVMKMIGAVLGADAANTGLVFWAWISWLIVIVVAILVSILWILNLWIDLFKRRVTVMKKVS